MTPAERLRRLREAAGHTQAQAAVMVHVHERTWRKWELGERDVPESVVHLYSLLTRQRYEAR